MIQKKNRDNGEKGRRKKYEEKGDIVQRTNELDKLTIKRLILNKNQYISTTSVQTAPYPCKVYMSMHTCTHLQMP